MVRILAAAALAALALGWGATGRAAAANGDATEKLLKDMKFSYTKVKDGAFKVVLEDKPGAAVIFVEEKVLGKDNSGKEVLFVYIYALVLDTPAEFKVPPAMLAKLNQVNDTALFGSVSLAKNKDGSYAMFRNSSALLQGLDGVSLARMLWITYDDKFRYAKDFRGFLDSP